MVHYLFIDGWKVLTYLNDLKKLVWCCLGPNPAIQSRILRSTDEVHLQKKNPKTGPPTWRRGKSLRPLLQMQEARWESDLPLCCIIFCIFFSGGEGGLWGGVSNLSIGRRTCLMSCSFSGSDLKQKCSPWILVKVSFLVLFFVLPQEKVLKCGTSGVRCQWCICGAPERLIQFSANLNYFHSILLSIYFTEKFL